MHLYNQTLFIISVLNNQILDLSETFGQNPFGSSATTIGTCSNTIIAFVRNFVTLALFVLALVAILMVILAAIRIILSGGITEEFEKGFSAIKNIIIGFILTFIFLVIVLFIVNIAGINTLGC